MILSIMMVFPFAARSVGPVVDIISPPITIESTASVVVAMRRYFPILARSVLKFVFVPPVYRFSEGLKSLGLRVKEVLVMSLVSQEGGGVIVVVVDVGRFTLIRLSVRFVGVDEGLRALLTVVSVTLGETGVELPN